MKLRPFEQAEIVSTYPWLADPYLLNMFLLQPPASWEDHQQYWLKVLADPTQCVLAIAVEEEHVGNCGFKHLAPEGTDAEIWIYIGSASHRGKGIGMQATAALLQHGTQVLGLASLYLHVAAHNEVAIGMYSKLGFALDGAAVSGEWQKHDCEILRMSWNG